MTAPAVLAVVAHPDGIEFVAAGTLLRLPDAGWQAHYLNLSGGDCGGWRPSGGACGRGSSSRTPRKTTRKTT